PRLPPGARGDRRRRVHGADRDGAQDRHGAPGGDARARDPLHGSARHSIRDVRGGRGLVRAEPDLRGGVRVARGLPASASQLVPLDRTRRHRRRARARGDGRGVPRSGARLTKTMETYTLYVMSNSPYSDKIRMYLRLKRLPVVEVRENLRNREGVLKARTGRTMVPVVITPADEALNDSTQITRRLE